MDEEQRVIQIPEVPDNRFWIVAVWQARTELVTKFGFLYDTKPGDCFVVGPNSKGDIPEGITGVVYSSTELKAIIPRLYMDDTEEDHKVIQSIIELGFLPFKLVRYTFSGKSIGIL